ncbi:hypothetical protein CD798_18005 [Bacillaceae bacterium SAOS 7]|nr:hypothetical protein CD798_18005 [Bacillaceae bacterium SAOS 7]
MLELNGKYNTAKVFTNNVEQTAMSQIIELCNQEFVQDSKIRIMPDTHAGAGCTIGTTMTIQDKIVPNLVGVDIGCVDKDTEFLSPNGWVKISEYNGQEIATYDLKIDHTHFEVPIAFIKKEETEFYHLKTKYGIDQMLSKEHTILIEKGSQHRPTSQGQRYTLTAEELFDKHSKLKLGFRDNFITEIPNLKISTELPLTDEQLRVQVMVMADGYLENDTVCVVKLKKERKIERIERLLEAANISYSRKVYNDVVHFRFQPPMMEKRISKFYPASLKQLAIICDEVKYWDYSIDHGSYCSMHKEDVDFVQYAFATQGIRTSISHDTREGKELYRCLVANSKPRVQLAGTPKTDIQMVSSEDGFKYCFTTNTGYWIMRRNGCVVVTGNCGMEVAIIDKNKTEVNFDQLDDTIRKYVPSGFSVRSNSQRHPLSKRVNFREVRAPFNLERAKDSIGTLGGGNHFVELNEMDDKVVLVIHSGSRNLGKQIAEHYQKRAYDELTDINQKRKEMIERLTKEGRQAEIQEALQTISRPKVSKDLAYLEAQGFDDYMNDMKIAQEYAMLNRKAMVDEIVTRMGWAIVDNFTTIHNYIDMENMILRKGAISAQKDERVIVPINMRDGSIIAIGKGNPDWNFSGPHGAGRIMSRSKAKQMLSLHDFEDSMDGIWTTSVGTSTLDEAPMVYKPIDEIMSNIEESLTIKQVIKPLYNFKAN